MVNSGLQVRVLPGSPNLFNDLAPSDFSLTERSSAVRQIRLRESLACRVVKENLTGRLLTNRWLTFREQINGSRAKDYPFGIVGLNVDEDGNGTGTFAPLCKIPFNKKKELGIEECGQTPFRLANVKREK